MNQRPHTVGYETNVQGSMFDGGGLVEKPAGCEMGEAPKEIGLVDVTGCGEDCTKNGVR